MGPFDPVAHGALDHGELAALGLRPEELLDFSSNLNPFGPPEEARAALATLDLAPIPTAVATGFAPPSPRATAARPRPSWWATGPTS